MTIRVVCYGLGPIGLGIARLVVSRPEYAVVGAVDIDSTKVGRDLGELLGDMPLGVKVHPDASAVVAETRPDVVLHATGSVLSQVVPQLNELLATGTNVISTCEELSYPWTVQPQMASELDSAARRSGVTLLGTGVNPGYVMDSLPLALTAPCVVVRSVRVTRIVDVAQRRVPLQRKVGVGITRQEFAQRVQQRQIGHVGLSESLHMLATSLRWELEQFETSIEPVVAKTPFMTEMGRFEAGSVRGIHQTARGFISGREVLFLDLWMYFDAPDPQDTIDIDGDPPIHMSIGGGIPGDTATAAIVVNAIPSVVRAMPGLGSMADIPIVHFP